MITVKRGALNGGKVRRERYRNTYCGQHCVACLSGGKRFRILAVFGVRGAPPFARFVMWGFAMAERADAVRKASKNAIPAQAVTKSEKTGARVGAAKPATRPASAPKRSTAKDA